MFKTIFGKLTAAFIIISIFCFTIAGVMINYFTVKVQLDDKIEAMKDTADDVESLYISWMSTENGKPNDMPTKQFVSMLSFMRDESDSMIWIVAPEGTIVYCRKIPGENVDFIQNESSIRTEYPNTRFKMPDPRQYKKVMEGSHAFVKEEGDLYGLFSGTKKSWLTIEKPIITIDRNGNKKVEGAVYLNTPMPQVMSGTSPLFKIFIVIVGLAFLGAVTLMYIFTKRVTKPLRKIKSAAKVIAKGEFNQRLDIRSSDEIGELAESFNHMAFALQHLEDNRREFIANVSHEIRTPITSIKGFIEGILDGTIPDEKRNTYLTIIRDEVGRVNRLVNDLLDLSKIESGELRLVMKKVDINELIRRCIIKLEGLVENKKLDIEACFQSEDLHVLADMDGIERVLINLMHNAIKFTPEGGKIEIGTFLRKEKVVVYVKDTGIGIDENDIKQIWHRFYKTDKSRGEDKNGTGLGLAIVKSIILEHKQDIWVESTPGKGSAFYFTLSVVSS